MAALFDSAMLRRPKGLPARAVLFTCVLLVVTGTLSAMTVLLGAQRESARHQLNTTRSLVMHMARISGDFLAAGDVASLHTMVQQTAARSEVRRLAVHDASNLVLADAGGSRADAAAVSSIAGRVLSTRQLVIERTPNHGLALGAPIVRDGHLVGAAMIMWDGSAYRFQVLTALAPFLLLLACLGLVAVPLTAHYVRRAVSPLDQLARFAERIAENGEPAPIEIRTGDEFETLATAFSKMTSKLDASMRQIQEIAFVDPATRLPNHDRFIREVDFFILQTRDEGQSGAVAVFELQRLPKLTHTLDPDAARNVLRIVAQRLNATVTTVDKIVRLRGEGDRASVVARLGGAEFGVFAPGLATPADAARFAQHVNAALNQPFDWRGHKLTLGACCGVAIAPRDGRDADAVIRHARMALSAAHTSPSRLKVFTQSLDREAVARLTLEREMRAALDRNEFRAYFQPKINLATGRIEAAEALARWVRPDRTIVSPGRFIPLAEESGLIGPLSDAILREACWKAASWARAGHPIKVAVNVSALQFRNDRFADQVLGVLRHAGLPPEQLELEITESVAVENVDRAMRLIAPLKQAGVRLAIDDFGCGQSSLAALSKLPFDVIKIDQQFVRALERGEAQAGAIVEMILALARTLDMEVVAEGVEKRESMEFMVERGCHWVQGFLFGAAVSAPEFAEVLRRQAGEDVEAEDAA
jgi:EAL domain-containing protein (putative c-di-GMP-specific phosphodiesterase class I)/GGDEF domain-containing protein